MNSELEYIDWNMGMLLEVKLPDPDSFLKIRETLTRIGVASHKDKTVYQSCHILHKQGRYFIVHFKELFGIDGKPSTITHDDIDRRNTIALLLADWNLLTIMNPPKVFNKSSLAQIKIVPYKDKKEYNLVAKYSIGNLKK